MRKDEIYTRWSQRSLVQWKELSKLSRPAIVSVQRACCGWKARTLAGCRIPQATLERCGIAHEVLDNAALSKRYPQVNFDDVTRGLLEPESGVLLARRGVQTVIEESKKHGVAVPIADRP